MTPSAATDTAAKLPTTYEAARDELTTVVATLEAGGLSLDESLTLWERGQALAGACEKFLAGAKERVKAALATNSSESGNSEHSGAPASPDNSGDSGAAGAGN